MRLVEAGYNIEAIVGQEIPPDADQDGSCMFWRPDSGLLHIKTQHDGSSGWSKLAKFNPYSKNLVYKTQSSGLIRRLIYGWDYDNNRIIVFNHENNRNNTIYYMADGAELLVTTMQWDPFFDDSYPRALFRVNNEYLFLMNSGWVWRRNVTNGGQAVSGDFLAPFGGDTSSMCYAGNGRVYFSRSTAANKKISEYKILAGQTPQPIKSFDWPVEIPAVGATGQKVNIAADYGNHLWIGVYNQSNGQYLIYKVDTTPVPSQLILDENPNFLPANGQSIGVITARVLDSTGIALPNKSVKIYPSGSYLSGSSLINPTTGLDVANITGMTDLSGTVTFTYRAPTVTGTQNFIVEASS